MNRRDFLARTGIYAAVSAASVRRLICGPPSGYEPGRIPNEYSLFLPGESETLARPPKLRTISGGSVYLDGSTKALRPGEDIDGWRLLAVTSMNGSDTAVFEKRVSHQGAIVYVTEAGGEILRIRVGIGQLSKIRPRPIHAPAVQFKRESPYRPGPDRLAAYILNSNEDPCYENVAALGPEYIGWTLVANEESGPRGSLFLQADGVSRKYPEASNAEEAWAPDLESALFDPLQILPDTYPELLCATSRASASEHCSADTCRLRTPAFGIRICDRVMK